MIAKPMKLNGDVVHRSTYCGLNEDEWINQAHILLRREFDSNTKESFGQDISPDNYPDVDLEDTPLYEMYEDYTTDLKGGLAGNTKDDEDPAMDTLLDREVPTPELNENYVNNSVMLPRGNIYARGKVIGRKRYADGNSVGRKNDNPIFETR